MNVKNELKGSIGGKKAQDLNVYIVDEYWDHHLLVDSIV